MNPSATPNDIPALASETDYVHLAAFRNALREFLHFSEQAALSAGIAPQQHQALLIIRGSPKSTPLTIGDLAAQLKVRHHSAVGLVNRMVAERFVKKSHDPANHRQVFVQLTARGRRTLDRLAPVHKAELARIGPTLRKLLDQLESEL